MTQRRMFLKSKSNSIKARTYIVSPFSISCLVVGFFSACVEEGISYVFLSSTFHSGSPYKDLICLNFELPSGKIQSEFGGNYIYPTGSINDAFGIYPIDAGNIPFIASANTATDSIYIFASKKLSDLLQEYTTCIYNPDGSINITYQGVRGVSIEDESNNFRGTIILESNSTLTTYIKMK